MTAVGSKCRVCKGPAVIDLPRHNAKFCAEHLQQLCRRQMAKAIEDFDMLSPHDRILVAVSGGKDSLAVWDMLIEAKQAYDETLAANSLDGEQLLAAQHQLSICEGSDWFWWFGDYNPADSVSDFESLYRMHLGNLYQLLGLEPPEYLAHTFARGSGRPAMGGVMRHGQARD